MLKNIRCLGTSQPEMPRSDLKKYRPFGPKTLAIKSPESYKELMGYKGFNPKKVDSLMKSLKVDHVLKSLLKFYEGL